MVGTAGGHLSERFTEIFFETVYLEFYIEIYYTKKTSNNIKSLYHPTIPGFDFIWIDCKINVQKRITVPSKTGSPRGTGFHLKSAPIKCVCS